MGSHFLLANNDFAETITRLIIRLINNKKINEDLIRLINCMKEIYESMIKSLF